VTRFLTANEAAAHIGVSRTTLHKWRLKFPVLRPVMLGGTMPRWTEQQLADFLALKQPEFSTRGGRRDRSVA
jgi:predicted DNA-binding transcriptional regulator AlpA